MKRLFTVILVLLTLLVGVSFTQLNSGSVVLNYYLGSVSMPLALVVVLSMGVGALLGIVVSLGIMLALRNEANGLRRKIALREQELKNLREIPLKDSR